MTIQTDLPSAVHPTIQAVTEGAGLKGVQVSLFVLRSRTHRPTGVSVQQAVGHESRHYKYHITRGNASIQARCPGDALSDSAEHIAQNVYEIKGRS